jgi:AcrR family transcriptional regulator
LSQKTRAPRLPLEVRRQQALDAALRLICERGYAAANMEAIARAMGVAKTVVYEAFGSRDKLLRALLEREERHILAALEVPAGGDLLDWVERGLAAVRENPAEWRLFLAPADGTPALVREHVEAGRAVVLRHLEGLLAPLHPPDLELAARAVLAMGERAALDVAQCPDRYSPERYSTFLRAIFDPLR